MVTIPVLVNSIVQRSENNAISVELLVILLVRAEEELTRTVRRRQQQSNFVDDDPDEEAFVVNCQAAPIGAKNSSLTCTLSMGDSRKLLKRKLIRRRLVTLFPVQY